MFKPLADFLPLIVGEIGQDHNAGNGKDAIDFFLVEAIILGNRGHLTNRNSPQGGYIITWHRIAEISSENDSHAPTHERAYEFLGVLRGHGYLLTLKAGRLLRKTPGNRLSVSSGFRFVAAVTTV